MSFNAYTYANAKTKIHCRSCGIVITIVNCVVRFESEKRKFVMIIMQQFCYSMRERVLVPNIIYYLQNGCKLHLTSFRCSGAFFSFAFCQFSMLLAWQLFINCFDFNCMIDESFDLNISTISHKSRSVMMAHTVHQYICIGLEHTKR